MFLGSDFRLKGIVVESSNKTGLLVWSSLAALAAGLVAVAVVVRLLGSSSWFSIPP